MFKGCFCGSTTAVKVYYSFCAAHVFGSISVAHLGVPGFRRTIEAIMYILHSVVFCGEVYFSIMVCETVARMTSRCCCHLQVYSLFNAQVAQCAAFRGLSYAMWSPVFCPR